jgi:Ser-tRNA(Ala) deacylase AlaX
MRTQTAMHVVNGVLWLDQRVQVTGVNMTPGEGRIDVELPSMPPEFGRDRQPDGGTHVASTAEVGHIRVLKTESKGRQNKRIRLAVVDA